MPHRRSRPREEVALIGLAVPAGGFPFRSIGLSEDHSSIAAAILRDLGCARASDIEGGFEAWQAAGLPIEAVAD